ncbi:UDP-glucose/GDP-mannose dehydrogenase family protein [Candidatus Woesearchaeota archaeon]|nr:MAG: UDP-glucose/GDP-mannose dehydrogenase family protein [Candidatus Woesearchaeota archaeon]
MKLTVIGTGYVGLCQGAAFSDVGHNVTCMDVDEAKISMLNDFAYGKSNMLPIFEPGLNELISKNTNLGRLNFTTNLEEAINGADVVFIAVGTPPNDEGKADLSALKTVCKNIGSVYDNINQDYIIVATKSTVPVGTYKVVKEIISSQTDKDFSVVSNPEFLAQGRAVKDCIKPSRIVIGTEDARALKVMLEVYRPYEKQGVPIYLMNNVEAELHKYAANSYLAAQVSLTNNFANLAKIVGADWAKVKEAVLADPRVGRFVHSSPGFGGSCFEKDVEQLTHTMDEYGADSTLLKEVLRQNRLQKELMPKYVKNYFGNLDGKVFALWGLAFKPETNDMRSSASIPLVKRLTEKGAKIKAYDPAAINEAKKVFGDNRLIEYVHDKYNALEGADALIVMTEWREFRSPDFSLIKNTLKNPVIFDGKDLYTLEEMKQFSLNYITIGKKDFIQ